MKMTRFCESDALKFYAVHKGKGFFNKLVNFMQSGHVVGLELIADGAIQKWRNFLEKEIRPIYGTDAT